MDHFSLDVFSVPEGLIVTQRVDLSFIAIFDPFGFASQFIMTVKYLFQEFWMLGINWGQEIPEPYKIDFLTDSV